MAAVSTSVGYSGPAAVSTSVGYSETAAVTSSVGYSVCVWVRSVHSNIQSVRMFRCKILSQYKYYSAKY